MASTAILAPMVGMFVLTFVVWTYLYVRRITYMRRERINPQKLRSPEHGRQLIPEEVNYPANNLANLFELPVIFYALCLLLYATGTADGIDVAAAWGFLVFRSVHSAVHCTVNRVMLRFTVYMMSSLFLWFLVARTGLRFLAGT